MSQPVSVGQDNGPGQPALDAVRHFVGFCEYIRRVITSHTANVNNYPVPFDGRTRHGAYRMFILHITMNNNFGEEIDRQYEDVIAAFNDFSRHPDGITRSSRDSGCRSFQPLKILYDRTTKANEALLKACMDLFDRLLSNLDDPKHQESLGSALVEEMMKEGMPPDIIAAMAESAGIPYDEVPQVG